mmetsp:Transcript_8410/g.10241  ORF Transcript_8410/g.10241 Transcript_8410/m.10241 type:complete len:1255 (+) Transcript_8410:91-3855(+)
MSYNNNNNNSNRNYYNRYSGSSKRSNVFGGHNNNNGSEGNEYGTGSSSSGNGYNSRNSDSSRGNYGGYRQNMNNSNSSKYGRYDKYRGGKNSYRGSNSSYYHTGSSSSSSNYNSRNANSYNRREPQFDRYDSYTERIQKPPARPTNISKPLSDNDAFKRNEEENNGKDSLELSNPESKRLSPSPIIDSEITQEPREPIIAKSESLFEDKPERRFDEPETNPFSTESEKIQSKADKVVNETTNYTSNDMETKKDTNHTYTGNSFLSKANETPIDEKSNISLPENSELSHSDTHQDAEENNIESNEDIKTESKEESQNRIHTDRSYTADDQNQSEKGQGAAKISSSSDQKLSKDDNDRADSNDNENNTTNHTKEEPESPTQSQLVANSSYLSPIADTASFDGSFLNHLPSVNDDKDVDSHETGDILTEVKEEPNENDSEAETIVTNSPPRINKGRKLVRKRDYDEDREKLIRTRKIIDSSDDDDDDNELSRYANLKENSESNDNKEPSKDSGAKRLYKIKRDSSGRSLLQRACKKGNLDDVKKLIDRGASPNERDFCGFTCLHEAALEGHIDIVKLLIEKGADVNKQALKAGDLETPLIDAAENKHFETVKVLLENGADPRIFNIDGFTALTKIFNEHDDEEGYEDIIKLLEEYNTKFLDSHDSKSKHQNKELLRSTISPSPSRIIEDPNDNYFSDLLKKKSHASSIYKYAAEGLKEFTANYFVEGGRLDYKPDILILAARNGHTELVDIILGLASGNFDINQENNCGLTALLASVGRGHYEVVKFLLLKGANPNKRRKPDGLNALEIAERASHFDANEVKLLQEHMNKSYDDDENDDSSEDDESIDMDDSFVSRKDSPKPKNKPYDETINKKRKSSRPVEDDTHNEKRLKKSKSREPEVRVKAQPSSVFNKEKTPDISDELKRAKSKELSFSPSSEASRDDKKHIREGSARNSPSPSPLTKVQEEIKAKNAEEARIWQEKVEAKKRARRDMFLKSEKERERKRKEDEEKRIEEEKRLAILQQEEKEKLAKLTEQKNKEIQEKRQILEKQLTIENYPIGLRLTRFGIEPTKEDILEFAPLYTFTIANNIYVTDLQLALLTRADVSSLIANISKQSMIEADKNQKSKLWNLFFPLIGIDKSKPRSEMSKLMYDGHTSFQYLLINFVRLDDVAVLIKDKYPNVYSIIWDKQNTSHVDIDSLQLFSDLSKRSKSDLITTNESEVIADAQSVQNLSFIPPKLKIRKDALKTIYNSKTPLW